MRAQILALAAVTTLSPFVAAAQHANGGAPLATRAPHEATQYDFLVGEWQLTVTPKVSGLAARIHGVPKMHGTWTARRALDGWGIEDELRIVDESGNPQAFTHFVRIYDATAKRWAISAIDVYRQQLSQSTAQWQGTEMSTAGSGTDGSGKAYTSRVRVARITPASFRYQQDRSYDGGRTWDEGLVVIEAKRSAAAAAR